jgi:uncharacterized protein YegL
MGQAIEMALDMVDDRKQTYKQNGVTYYRPWVFLMTDGGPTDPWEAAARRVHAGEAAKKFVFFAVGVSGAEMGTLAQIAPPTRAPIMMAGLQFKELFTWLSSSLAKVSQSKAGDPNQQVALPPTSGWTTVGT